MGKNIKITIAIPAYKDIFLKEAIDSIFNQTYSNYEIIIVNDASPYNISQIISQYNDERLFYSINEQNCGAKDVVDNWNICLSKSNGEYLLCMGDDDKLKDNCLQDFVDLIQQYPDVDLFHSRTEIIDDNSNYVETLDECPEWESVLSFIYTFKDSGLGSYLYKVSTLRKLGGFYKLPYGWSSDFITAFMVADKHGLVHTKEPGFQYRCNCHSISHDTKSIEYKIMANLKACEWINLFVAEKKVDNNMDSNLRDIIPSHIRNLMNRKNDDLIEFDIRKNFFNKSLFWLFYKGNFKISKTRVIKCILKSIKYKYRIKS